MTYLKIIQTYFIVDGNIVLEVLSSVKKNVEFIPKSVTTLIQRQWNGDRGGKTNLCYFAVIWNF